MLLLFSVANYLSFKEEVTLNMMPAKSRVMKDHELSDELGKSVRALPIATLYGANASGKSNLVSAFEFIQRFALHGAKADAATGVTPYLLDADCANSASRFELVFKHEGVVYTYGMCVSKKTVEEEWLFARYTSQESRVFERVTREGRTVVEAGPKLGRDAGGSQFVQFVAKGTRPNQPFLTEAHQKNIELVKPVMHWFRGHLQVIRPHTHYGLLPVRADRDRDFLDYLSRFLRVADTGVERLHCQRDKLDFDKHLPSIPDEKRQRIEEELDGDSSTYLLLDTPTGRVALSKEQRDGQDVILYRRIMSQHRRNDDSLVYFEVSAESDGTRRIIDLAPALEKTWKRNGVFIIDELDQSLHTQLARFFIQSVIEGVTEKGAQGQFIMTTHDTNLLDRDLLRRDEIWFMEKEPAGASHLTSLAEYKVSEGLNYENGYLNGRFGAIPFIGDHRELLK